jgi:hypothetical protein
MDPEHWFLLTLRDVVGGGVHLDNLHILVRHLGAQLVIDGGQLLAVAAPRRVELNQHVLGSRRNITIHLKKNRKLSRSENVRIQKYSTEPFFLLLLQELGIRIRKYLYGSGSFH